MYRAIKIRLYPNKTQEQILNRVLGSYRFVYNQMLARKQNAYNADKTNLSVCDLSKWFHGTLLKDDQYAWLKEQNTKVMKQAIRQMDFVDRFYPSSKTCSVCGYKKRDLMLSDREWVCPKCGTMHDRDVNAAVNILLEGQRKLKAE